MCLRASRYAENAEPLFRVGCGCVWLERLKILLDIPERDCSFVCEFFAIIKNSAINVDNGVRERCAEGPYVYARLILWAARPKHSTIRRCGNYK